MLPEALQVPAKPLPPLLPYPVAPAGEVCVVEPGATATCEPPPDPPLLPELFPPPPPPIAISESPKEEFSPFVPDVDTAPGEPVPPPPTTTA